MSVELLPGYVVKQATVDDAARMLEAYLRNREHLAPWEPVRDEAFFTEAAQRSDLEARVASAAEGRQDSWTLWHDDEVVGRVNLSNIARGVFQNANLGYWVDHRHTGRGLASAAVRFAVRRATDLGLHRIEAGTLLHNVASQAVLRRCGFVEFGLAPSYLFIGGSWQDHVMFQRVLHDGDPERQVHERVPVGTTPTMTVTSQPQPEPDPSEDQPTQDPDTPPGPPTDPGNPSTG